MMQAYGNLPYSPVQEAASSLANCLAGEPSAPSSLTPTPQAYLSPDKMKEYSRLSRFGMTFALLTENRGAELLTLFRADFPARTFPSQVKARESTAQNPVSGANLPESLAKYDRATSLWKTRQPCLFADSAESSVIWPRSGMMRAGACWAQTIAVRRTSESESGFGPNWPTPTCHMAKENANKSALLRNTPGLGAAVHYWQTPVRDDAVSRVNGKINSRGEPKLSAQVLRWPTPTANEDAAGTPDGKMQWMLTQAVKSGYSTRAAYEKSKTEHIATPESRWENPDRSRNLNDQIGGQLSANWVELLMGWPRTWTALHPIAAADWALWLEKHGWPIDWERDEPRIVAGATARVARLRAIGNGQVPICAATAWEILSK